VSKFTLRLSDLKASSTTAFDGMKQFWADIDAAWAEFRIAPEEFRELDGEILVLGRAFARGRESGIVIDAAAAWIARLS
jgi:hypothetical protein